MTPPLVHCGEGTVHCLDALRCVNVSRLCDGVDDCLDKSDENELCEEKDEIKYN